MPTDRELIRLADMADKADETARLRHVALEAAIRESTDRTVRRLAELTRRSPARVHQIQHGR